MFLPDVVSLVLSSPSLSEGLVFVIGIIPRQVLCFLFRFKNQENRASSLCLVGVGSDLRIPAKMR